MPRVGNPKRRRPHFVKEWRKFRGLTQEQLADHLHTTKANISRIENLHQGYTQDFLEACAEVLKTEPAALISGEPEKRPDAVSMGSSGGPHRRKSGSRSSDTL